MNSRIFILAVHWFVMGHTLAEESGSGLTEAEPGVGPPGEETTATTSKCQTAQKAGSVVINVAGCPSSCTKSSPKIGEDTNSVYRKLQETMLTVSKQVLAELKGVKQHLRKSECPEPLPWPAPTKPAYPACPPGQVQFRGSCYIFDLHQTDWVTAQRRCEDLYSARLVSIDSEEEQNFLTAKIKSKDLKPKVPYKYWGFWAAGNDLEHEGKWVWHGTGKRIRYSAWGGRQPDNNYCGSPENCLQLVRLYDYMWNDMPCYINTLSYICERPARIILKD